MTVRAISQVIQSPNETPATPPFLDVRELGFAFGDRQVLHRLSFQVEQGESFGILGPNGSGKSTVLSILAGLLLPQSGDALIHPGGLRPGDRRMRSETGVVFQNPSLDDKLTARQNLILAATLHGMSGPDVPELIEESLALAGLRERANDSVGTFSGGMKRRLDIGRALLPSPRLLLMDEPTSGLDEAAFRSTWTHLQAIKETMDLTIVVTTHRAEEAERCDRLAVLHRGAAKVVDTPMGLRQQIASDIILLKATNPTPLCAEIAAKFSVTTRIDGEHVVVECERGHDLIPRIVEGYPAGRLQSVNLRQPTLADVFLKVTGQQLITDIDHPFEEESDIP